jgi:hypothetical protein
VSTVPTTEYVPGSCNIGPAEIARRRRAGHAALAVTLAFGALALATDAPRPARLLIFIPAYGAAIGYLQAASRFCAGFAMRGVYNFAQAGRVETVGDQAARERDRHRALRMSGRAGLMAALVAAAFSRV